MEPEQLRQELNELGPTYGIRIAIISSICSAIGFAVSIYVYVCFSHPTSVLYLGRGTELVSESVMSYLFGFPIFMAMLCVMVALGSLLSYLFPQKNKEWSEFVRRNHEDMFKNLTGRPPRQYSGSAKNLLNGVTVAFTLINVFLLGATIYRSYLIAVGHFA